MKVFLMYRDRDFDRGGKLPSNADALTQDLELDRLLAAMALGDVFLFDVCKRAVLASLDDPDAITYRQQVLRDCLENREIVREIYDLAVETLQAAKRIWRGTLPDSLVHGSVSELQLFVQMLKKLRQITDDHAACFRSEGFTSLFRMLAEELDDDYFQEIEDHLGRLRFRDGVLVSAVLGKGNKGTDYVLRLPRDIRQSWLQRLSVRNRSALSFQISERDEAGGRALREIRARGIVLVATALAQSADHIASFLRLLQTELAFYLGCINLRTRLTQKREPTCFPMPARSGTCALAAQGLYDPCLSLLQDGSVVGNDVDADGKALVMITGANQGGKSTFLRSVGVAQLMMQCGMFVAASSFRADVRHGLFTHFRREEDPTMKSGKLDEELGRMSDIADLISSHGMILFNESFAATNEREGSEIARQVVRALLEAGVKVFFVTHLFDLAQSLFAERMGNALFLRPERQADGGRTFRVVEGEPLPTSYGKDLYRQVFETAPPEIVGRQSVGGG
jgi:DNA mismatch repair ATPase MutS